MPSLQALLTDTYSLRRAAVVDNPEYPTDLFPLVYGDLIGGKSGISYCPGIVESTYTYLIADHAIATEAMGNFPTFYVDGVATVPSSWNPATTVAGRTCATVTFGVSQAGSRIGYRGMGAVAAGALLTNPVSVVEDFLTSHVGLTSADFDATALALARATAARLGYACAGILEIDRSPGTTVSEILACFGGYYYVSPAGTLVIVIDDGLTPDLPGIPRGGVLRAHELEQAEATWTLGTIVNQCAVHYCRNHYDISLQQRFQATDDGTATRDTASQQLYGARGPGATEAALEFPWVRDGTSVQTAQRVVVSRLAKPRASIRAASPSFRLAHLKVGQHLVFSWPRLFDDYRRPLVNQIGLIEEVGIDGDTPQVHLTFRDTGAYVSRAYPANGDYTAGGTIQAGSERDRRDY